MITYEDWMLYCTSVPLGDYEKKGHGVRLSYYSNSVSAYSGKTTRENLILAAKALNIISDIYNLEDLQIDFFRVFEYFREPYAVL